MIIAATITPLSDVVGEITNSTFEITLNHEISQDGSIEVNFPKWNPNAAIGSIFSVIQGTYVCTAKSVFSSL